MAENSRKRNARRGTLIAVMIALLLSLIGGTYARYTSSASGSGTVSIAKWVVKVNTKDISNGTAGTFDITFFTDENDHVVEGKIAPSVTATGYVDVDLTGTEVSVAFDCTKDATTDQKLKDIFGTDASRVTLTVGEPAIQGGAQNMTLSADKKYVQVGSAAMSGTVRVPITLEWENNETFNVQDTLAGSTAVTDTNKESIIIPVTLNVKQYIPTT